MLCIDDKKLDIKEIPIGMKICVWTPEDTCVVGTLVSKQDLWGAEMDECIITLNVAVKANIKLNMNDVISISMVYYDD